MKVWISLLNNLLFTLSTSNYYSLTCLKRPPFLLEKCGPSRQEIFWWQVQLWWNVPGMSLCQELCSFKTGGLSRQGTLYDCVDCLSGYRCAFDGSYLCGAGQVWSLGMLWRVQSPGGGCAVSRLNADPGHTGRHQTPITYHGATGEDGKLRNSPNTTAPVM